MLAKASCEGGCVGALNKAKEYNTKKLFHVEDNSKSKIQKLPFARERSSLRVVVKLYRPLMG